MMRQREAGDIWQGLHELHLVETPAPILKTAMTRELRKLLGEGAVVVERIPRPPHILSHQRIEAVFWTIRLANGRRLPKAWSAVPTERLHELAVPRLIERWLERMSPCEHA